MQAVIMAAGEGQRLRPLTERYAKPVLPIDGRPVIVTLLRELDAAGIGPVTVVVGHLGAQIEALLAGLDVEPRFARQPRADGSADAVRCAGLDAPYLVLGADTVFSPGDVGRFLEAASGADGAVAVRRRPGPGPARMAVRVEDGLVTRIRDGDPGNRLAGAPLWLVGTRVAEHLGGLPGPPFELADAVERAIAAGAQVRGVEIGPTRDLTSPLDLVDRNFPYLRVFGEP
jgi:NDP-sugar pyrophosphorylase family protein